MPSESPLRRSIPPLQTKALNKRPPWPTPAMTPKDLGLEKEPHTRNMQPYTPMASQLVDHESQQHLYHLLASWLMQAHLPATSLADALLSILLRLPDLWEKASSSTSESDADPASNDHNNKNTTLGDALRLELLDMKKPSDSCFLVDAQHGEALSKYITMNDIPCAWLHGKIGGTIRIYGVPQGELHRVANVIMTAIYTLWSLWLENRVMRDHRLWGQHAIDTTMSHELHLAEKKETATTRKGFVQWLKTGLRGYMSSTAQHTPPAIPSTPKKPSYRHNIMKRASSASLSLLTKEKTAKKSDAEQAANIITTTTNALAEDDPLRFSKLLERLQSAPVASSPHCKFTPPRVLTRLQDDEKDLTTLHHIFTLKNKQQHAKKNFVKRTSSILSMIGKKDNEASEPTASLPEEGMIPQSIAAYSVLRMPPRIRDAKIGLNFLMLETGTLQAYQQHQNLTLSYTAYPIGCPQRPCLGPLLCRMEFFRYQQQSTNGQEPPPFHYATDRSLGETILGWCASQDKACKAVLTQKMERLLQSTNPSPVSIVSTSSTGGSEHTDRSSSDKGSITEGPQRSLHGCDHPFRDHVLSFSHGVAKINVYLNVDPSHARDPEKSTDNSKDILVWMACNICEKETEHVLMSEPTFHCSLAMYLEWILYSQRFVTPSTLCEHAHTKINTAWLFQPRCCPSLTLKLVYEEAALYELRPPRLQVVPDVEADVNTAPLPTPPQSPHPDTTSGNSTYVSAVTLKEWAKSLSADVDAFFTAVSNHMELLHRYLKAEYNRQVRSETDASRKQQILSTWQQQLQSWSALHALICEQEQASLRRMLQENPTDLLNDFRRAFAAKTAAIMSQLEAWQKAQCPDLFETCDWEAPDYIKSDKVHSFPGSSILVREEEPSSIIAYSLSSTQYRQELELHRFNSNESSEFGRRSRPASVSSYVTRHTQQYDGHRPESNDGKDRQTMVDGYSSTIERKYVAPSAGAATETASFRAMVLETIKANASELHHHQQRRFQEFVERLAYPKEDHDSKKYANPTAAKSAEAEQQDAPKAQVQVSQRVLCKDTPEDTQHVTAELKMASYLPPQAPPTSASTDTADTATTTTTASATSATTAASTSTAITKPALSPHVKHKFIHNNIQFTCIVYYASEFETLRRHCGIDQLMIQSLSRCDAWRTTGGKSKSHFYKTQDDRLVVKEMVNAWNNVERESFLKFAPKYLDYMKRSSKTPSILAKIFGFYTIRIQHLAEKRVILNMDVMVMEHLFYGMANNITRKFDFKGIRDRRVEEHRKTQEKSCTLWDGDWIDGYRITLPVHKQSKAVIENAIQNDTEFLATGNIMDYSLLVGVDEKTKELTVGIVDYIGTYTWYKKLESKSKSTLKPNKEVTVLPPEQYKWRFGRLMDDYFVAIPGKFDQVQDSQLVSSAMI